MNISELRLPPEAYEVFRLKGERNAQNVRRIVQIMHDLAGLDLSNVRILDVGCAEGVYALEAALRGATVLATDARDERLRLGREIAEKLGIDNLRFEVRDVRSLSVETDGEFDVVYLLGLLYHLEANDGCRTISRLASMCRRMMIIDTHVALSPLITDRCEYQGRIYEGKRVIEHDPGDSEAVKRARLGNSLDNEYSFHFSARSLQRLLVEAGFSSVFECHVPLAHLNAHPANRVTYVALKGERQSIASYPWINDLSEDEIDQRVAQFSPERMPSHYAGPPIQSVKRRNQGHKPLIARVKDVLNGCVRLTGYELRRLPPSKTTPQAQKRHSKS